MARMGHYLTYLAVRVAICIVQAIPLAACRRAAFSLAWLFADVLRLRRSIIDENLRLAFPEADEARRAKLARRMWRHLLLFVAEVAHTPRKIHATNWRDYVHFRDSAGMVRLLLADRPLLMVTAHFGNFELAGYIFALFGYTFHAVARPLDNPFLDEFIHRARCQGRLRILSKKGDYERIGEILAAGGNVSFLADQYAGSKGCWVDFFGREASAHKAIALFALHHDAPVAVGCCRRVGGPLHYEMTLEGVADPRLGNDHTAGVRELTQWFTARLEGGVRRAPEQYWWLHRRWKDNRQMRKLRSAAKSAA